MGGYVVKTAWHQVQFQTNELKTCNDDRMHLTLS